jgi:type III restriction enzyme
MKLTLKEFQTEAADKLRGIAARAASDVAEDGPQSLVLAAPTGAGKTVVAAQFMELVVEGDEQRPPDPDATFLWITDDPELNEQTWGKLHKSTTVFRAARGKGLKTIEASFHAEKFSPGWVYFLNTQKMMKTGSLVRRGEGRTYTIWDTIANTATDRPSSFWVIIDEAHKGMAHKASQVAEAQTTIQKFIVGEQGEVPPMPLVLGISATPDRFQNLLSGTQRTNRPPVAVSAEDVRGSGLLKETITLYHPDEKQPSDFTLLRAAAEQLKRYEKEWADYCENEQAPLVSPVLVVQVEDGTGKTLSRTDIASCLRELEAVLGPLDDASVAHSFQENYAVLLGDGRSLRYVAPSRIESEAALRVVFFKRSLTTGWDCPRAEVMMSFRKALDQTLIAQLVGRMVRTPLARAVFGSDFLNSVCLYLPHYDKDALSHVIRALSEPDPEQGIPTTVQLGNNLVTLTKNPATKEAFDAAAKLDTYYIQKATTMSAVRRVLKLGRLLGQDKLDTDGLGRYKAALYKVLSDERKKVAGSKEFQDRLNEAATVDVRAVTVAYGLTDQKEVVLSQMAAADGNIDHAFAEAGRKLGGGMEMEYLKSRIAEVDAPPPRTVKLELYTLLQRDALLKAIENEAASLIGTELDRTKTQRQPLPDDRRQLYREIARQGAKPLPEPWELPDSIEGPKDGNTKLPGHLYLSDSGEYACELNGWERDALKNALDESDAAGIKVVIGWLRNEPRKSWSFAVPYDDPAKPMYPDFLIFRRDGNGVLCDILEPHALSFSDSAAKAKGLAAFARDHGDEFGRIRLITKLGGSYEGLALDDIETRDKVLGVATPEHLKQLFETA